MSGWAAKRFWTSVDVVPAAAGFSVTLDGRPVRTPGRRPLAVPTRALAEAIAGEWDAVSEAIDPRAMPWTRSANSAIDKVPFQRSDIEAHLIGYAETDLLAYRAEAPAELARRQAEGWDPVLDWVAECFGARLRRQKGVMPVAQDATAIARLAEVMGALTHFELTGFHELVTLSGSFALALSVMEEARTPEEAWALSRIDETWQIEQWGVDAEAKAAAEAGLRAFRHGTDFLRASRHDRRSSPTS